MTGRDLLAQATPAYRVQETGSLGLHGWRVHCDCGYLSRVYANRFTVHAALDAHKRKCAVRNGT